MNTKPGLRQRVVTTLAAWAAAYTIVAIVFAAGGQWLAAAPTPVRLLVVSGVLVIVMVNVLMPFLGRLVARLFMPAKPGNFIPAKPTNS